MRIITNTFPGQFGFPESSILAPRPGLHPCPALEILVITSPVADGLPFKVISSVMVRSSPTRHSKCPWYPTILGDGLISLALRQVVALDVLQHDHDQHVPPHHAHLAKHVIKSQNGCGHEEEATGELVVKSKWKIINLCIILNIEYKNIYTYIGYTTTHRYPWTQKMLQKAKSPQKSHFLPSWPLLYKLYRTT